MPVWLETRRSRVKHSFVEIDHEIFSVVILSLPLIQEGQLSVSGERMCTILVNLWLGKLTALDMTPLGWLGCKTSTQTNKQNSRPEWFPLEVYSFPIMLSMLGKTFGRHGIEIFFFYFPRKEILILHANCLHLLWQFAWNVWFYCSGKNKKKYHKFVVWWINILQSMVTCH